MARAKASTKNREWSGAFEQYNNVKEKVKDNIWVIVLAFIAYYASSLILTLFVNVIFGHVAFIYNIVADIVNIGLVSLFLGTLTALYLDVLRNKVKGLEDYVKISWENIGNMFVAIFVVTMITIVSILLLIVPFFFVFPRLLMVPYLVIAKKLKAMDAISASWHISKNYYGEIYGIIGLQLLCWIPALIGLILGAITGIWFFGAVLTIAGIIVSFYLYSISLGASYSLSIFMFDNASK